MIKSIRFLRFAQDGANSYRFRSAARFAAHVFMTPVMGVIMICSAGENLIEIEITTSRTNMLEALLNG